MKIAVTTASGSLGSAIVSQLKNDIGSENVIGIARTPEKASHLGVEIRKGDYGKREEFVEALQGVNVVLLVSGNGDPAARIPMHRNVISAAEESGVRKLVYTSIFGAEQGNAFSPIVSSNRQTEEDLRNSTLEWAIGRNGIYIEPDIEYIETYKQEGGITNCADDGRCGYTSRLELGVAYSNLLRKDEFNGKTYNLLGHGITQEELVAELNAVFDLSLSYTSVSVEDYLAERKQALGDFMGTVIGGIYAGIREGKFNGESHFEHIVGTPHATVKEMIERFKAG